MIDDRGEIAHAFRYGTGSSLRQRECCFRYRSHVGLEAEQARSDFVMQLQRGAPSLVVLGGDNAPIEREVLGADVIERTCERVEAIDDGGEFQYLRTREPHLVVALLQSSQPCAEGCERVEQATEHPMEYPNHRQHGHDGDRRKCDGVLPDFGDFVAWLADNLHGADGSIVNDDRYDVSLDRWTDQHGEPRRSDRTAVLS